MASPWEIGKMTVKPTKTERYGTKLIKKTTDNLALVLLQDEIKEADQPQIIPAIMGNTATTC